MIPRKELDTVVYMHPRLAVSLRFCMIRGEGKC